MTVAQGLEQELIDLRLLSCCKKRWRNAGRGCRRQIPIHWHQLTRTSSVPLASFTITAASTMLLRSAVAFQRGVIVT